MSHAADDFDTESWGRRCLDLGNSGAKALWEAGTDEAATVAGEAFLWREAPLACRLVARLAGLNFLARRACAELHAAPASMEEAAKTLDLFARRASDIWIEPKLPGRFLELAFCDFRDEAGTDFDPMDKATLSRGAALARDRAQSERGAVGDVEAKILYGCGEAASAWRQTLDFHCASLAWDIALCAPDKISTGDWKLARALSASQSMKDSGCAGAVDQIFTVGPLETAALAFSAHGKVHERGILQFAYAIIDRIDTAELAMWREGQARELSRLADNAKGLEKLRARINTAPLPMGRIHFATLYADALAQDAPTRERQIKAPTLGLFLLADPRQAVASVVAAGEASSPRISPERSIRLCGDFGEALAKVDVERSKNLSAVIESAEISLSVFTPMVKTASSRSSRL